MKALSISNPGFLASMKQVASTPLENVGPTANAGVDQTITLPTNSITLTGSASDSDGTIASYGWTKVSGGAATITSPNAATTTVTGLAAGVYIFRLTATDNSGATASDDIQIAVNVAAGTAPTVTAGVDRSMTYPAHSLTMLGSGTGTGVTYKWTKVSGPYTYTIVDNTNPGTVVKDLTEGVYIFRLTITDSSNQTAYDDMQITVNAALPAQPTGQVADLSYRRMTFTADGTSEYDTWNIIQKLPTGYNPAGSTYYPVIIYFPMLGNEGRDFNTFIQNGPQKFMSGKYSNGTTNPAIWNGKVTTGGITYDPIIISIQPVTAWPESKWLVGAFNYVLSNYKVDLGRVYVTGGSMGGWSTLRIWSYNQTMANKVTAFVTASAVAPCNSPFTCLQKTMNGRALMFWQSTEYPYNAIATDNPAMVTVIQNANTGKPDAVRGTQTNIGDGSHGYWDSWFDPTATMPAVSGLSAYKNYEWMFTQVFT